MLSQADEATIIIPSSPIFREKQEQVAQGKNWDYCISRWKMRGKIVPYFHQLWASFLTYIKKSSDNIYMDIQLWNPDYRGLLHKPYVNEV